MKKISLLLSLLLCLSLWACQKQEPPALDVPQQVFTPTIEAVKDPEPEPQRVSFYGAGDNLIHNCLYWQADDNAEGPDFDFTPMYAAVAKDIESADIAYINQETILGGTELGLSSYPMFNSPQEVGRDMIELGFDVFSHATNHVFDKGPAGMENTYRFYEGKDALCVGLYKTGEKNLKILERRGVTVAFLNYTDLTNGFVNQSSDYYVPLAEEGLMARETAEAAEAADFVICLMHWGEEGQSTPTGRQRELAKVLADAGCDAVIGTHPHVIQPVEYVDGMLTVWSLGNYISAQKAAANMVGGVIRFDMVKQGAEKRIENVRFEPVINQYEAHFANIRIIPWKDYTEELAKAHGAGITYAQLEDVIARQAENSKY